MADINTVRAWEGRTLIDRDGSPVGSINAIYLDDRSGQPEWALVNTGLFGTRSSFVPLAQAARSGENVQVPYDKRLIKDAPRVEMDQHLSEAEERQLWRHYGLDYDTATPSAATGMRKYVTTEELRQAVPLRRERVRLEREPITDANLGAATSGPELSEEEHEVTLREEEPVVEKRVVPRERVRLDTETVTDERQVAEEVRKEHIEVEGDQDRPSRRDDDLR
jgi:uncharacterized protein (TIGR02271 family)